MVHDRNLLLARGRDRLETTIMAWLRICVSFPLLARGCDQLEMLLTSDVPRRKTNLLLARGRDQLETATLGNLVLLCLLVSPTR